MTETWYRMSYYGEPSAIEVESSTEHFIKPVGLRRRAKITDYETFHPTLKAAWEWLAEESRKRAEKLTAEVRRLEEKIANCRDNEARAREEASNA